MNVTANTKMRLVGSAAVLVSQATTRRSMGSNRVSYVCFERFCDYRMNIGPNIVMSLAGRAALLLVSVLFTEITTCLLEK